jgi:hypothetical protein
MNLSNALTTQQVAEMIGVKPRTVTSYLSKGSMPSADGYVDNKPIWRKATIREWLFTRPGRGIGGGRPAHRVNRAA